MWVCPWFKPDRLAFITVVMKAPDRGASRCACIAVCDAGIFSSMQFG
jgi:hypothetical protein